MNVNFAKLNHILIPQTKEGRDRLRRSRFGRLVTPLGWALASLSEEGRMLVILSLVIGGFGLDAQATRVFVLWSAIAAIVVASLLMTFVCRLRDVRIEVRVPRRATIGEETKFGVILQNGGVRDVFALRVGGPFLPWDGQWIGPPPRVPLVRAGNQVRVDVAARFASRGEHHLDGFGASALVPIGLAQVYAAFSAGCKFLVVPKIARVTHVNLPRASRHQPGGVALASKTGESMDLLGVRPYRPGDPVRHLHARSSARAGSPVVREYQEEYFSRIGVVIDAAVPDPRRLEAMLSLAAGVVAHLSRGEALIDLLVVGDRIHDLTIGRHLGFLDQALDLLACVQPEPAPIDPDRLVRRLGPHLRRLSSVVVIAPQGDGGALANRLRGFGLACRVIVVDANRAGSAGQDTLQVSVEAIERGEALSL